MLSQYYKFTNLIYILPEQQKIQMQITTLALAFSEWGIGRFPLDLIVFLSVVLIFALPAGINRKKIFVEGDAFTTRLKS